MQKRKKTNLPQARFARLGEIYLLGVGVEFCLIYFTRQYIYVFERKKNIDLK